MVLLHGPLGAGKTALVRAIAAGMGLDTAAACSPTYVLVHVYDRRADGAPAGTPLVHVDAYRLTGDDADTLGLDRLLGADTAAPMGASPVVAVEWAERLPEHLLAGRKAARIRIDPVDDTTREMSFSLPDDWSSRAGVDRLLRRGPTRCPITGKPVPADSPTWPFADERARMADLHRWISGRYTISRSTEQDDQG